MTNLKTLFRYFLGLIIVSFFLPTFVALPYTTQAAFYFPIWVVLVGIFYPKTIFNFGFLGAFLFLILHVIYNLFGLYKTDTYSMLDYFWPMAFSFSVIEYFNVSKDYTGLYGLTKLTFILIIITMITSIVSLTMFPSAARDMAGFLSATGQYELNRFYLYIGIGNYYFFHNVAFIVPIIVFLFQNKQYLNFNRVYLIIFLALIFLAIYRGGFSSAFGLFFIGLSLGLFLNMIRSPLYYLILISIFYLQFNLIGPLLAPAFYATADLFDDSEYISPRLRNLASNFDGSSKLLDDRDLKYTEGYEIQLAISTQAFLENPLTGSGKQGGHHHWIDLLSKFGLIGFIPWILIMIYMYRSRVRPLKGTFKLIYFHVLMCLIFLGLFKPIGLEDMFSFVAIFLPAFLYYAQFKIMRLVEGTPDIAVINSRLEI